MVVLHGTVRLVRHLTFLVKVGLLKWTLVVAVHIFLSRRSCVLLVVSWFRGDMVVLFLAVLSVVAVLLLPVPIAFLLVVRITVMSVSTWTLLMVSVMRVVIVKVVFRVLPLFEVPLLVWVPALTLAGAVVVTVERLFALRI